MNRSFILFVMLALVMTGCSDETNRDLAQWTPGGKALAQDVSTLEAENQQLKGEVDTLSAQTSASQQQLAAMQAELAAKEQALAEARKKAEAQAKAEEAQAKRLAQAVRITVPGDNLFASGQVVVKASAKPTLAKIAATILRDYPGADVTVEGYTDTDPIRKSKWKSNEALSLARANAVRTYLIEKGLNPGNVSAVGMGSTRPKATKAASRRVELVVVPAS